MTTTLTLLIEKRVIERAKRYAKLKGKSLSELIENYLTELTREEPEGEISPKLKSIAGAIKLPKDFDDDKEHRQYLENKHLGKV